MIFDTIRFVYYLNMYSFVLVMSISLKAIHMVSGCVSPGKCLLHSPTFCYIHQHPVLP